MEPIQRMIGQLQDYGIRDPVIIRVFEMVPRHWFVSGYDMDTIYSDGPLPVGFNQTISQPYTVALMLQAMEIEPGMKILEIGTGSGWSSALIKSLCGNGTVITIERISALAAKARSNLIKAGIEVEVIEADGSEGYSREAPYDRIVLAAACPKIPRPLISQLKEGGIIVAPVGEHVQSMIQGRKQDGELTARKLGEFRFVPLIGRFGF
jgi:protein-L-isoaspartate(D-aspartate) O-methyltransferase